MCRLRIYLALRDEVTSLKKELESKVAAIEAKISQLQNVTPK